MKSSVLIVDDRAEIRELLRFQIDEIGLPSVEAESGQQAMQLVDLYHPKIVLSDFDMGRGNGLWLLEQLQLLKADNPRVIFLSAKAEQVGRDLLSRGAEAVFGKPWNSRKLLELVRGIYSQIGQGFPAREFRVDTDFIMVDENKQTFKGRNLSFGGAFVDADSQLRPPVGTSVTYSIQREGWKPVIARAEVKWHSASNGFGVAVTSDLADDAKLLALVNFLKTGEALRFYYDKMPLPG